MRELFFLSVEGLLLLTSYKYHRGKKKKVGKMSPNPGWLGRIS